MTVGAGVMNVRSNCEEVDAKLQSTILPVLLSGLIMPPSRVSPRRAGSAYMYMTSPSRELPPAEEMTETVERKNKSFFY
jgi:hypothetical protein